MSSLNLVKTAAQAAWDKKGFDLEVLDISKAVDFADYFLIISGQNNRHVDSIIDAIKQRVKKDEMTRPISVEGLETLDWALLDYGDVVIHVFQEEPRDYYRLGSLWGDVPRVPLTFLDSEDEDKVEAGAE